jgi:Right handed beta helix region
MATITSCLVGAALAALGALTAAAPAQAQLARTFVSVDGGNNRNDCSRAAPCRTFQAAHDRTSEQGEIVVLDPGHYGAVTIAKAISIINRGAGEAGVLPTDGSGITINAPATANIVLRGLTIEGAGFGGGTGIRFNSGASLTIEDCFIHNNGREGIDFFPIGNSSLAVSNTLVADNGGQGVLVRPTGASAVMASFDHVEIYNNGRAGLLVRGTDSAGAIGVTVSESVSANNRDGFRIDAGDAPASLVLLHVVAADNRSYGIASTGAHAIVRLGGSTLSGNGSSWMAAHGAALESDGDNTIRGNGDGDLRPQAVVTE